MNNKKNIQKVIFIITFISLIILFSFCSHKKEEELYTYLEKVVKKNVWDERIDSTYYTYKFYARDDKEAYLEAFKRWRMNALYLITIVNVTDSSDISYISSGFELRNGNNYIADLEDGDDVLRQEMDQAQKKILSKLCPLPKDFDIE